jgi:hypothetical protein
MCFLTYRINPVDVIEEAFKAVLHDRMKGAPNLKKALLKDSIKYLHASESPVFFSKRDLEYLMDAKV